MQNQKPLFHCPLSLPEYFQITAAVGEDETAQKAGLRYSFKLVQLKTQSEKSPATFLYEDLQYKLPKAAFTCSICEKQTNSSTDLKKRAKQLFRFKILLDL